MPQKLINWYLSCQAIPYWYVLLTDCCIVLFSGMVGYTINHGLPPSTSALGNLFIAVCAYLPCYVVGFRLFHTYSGIIRQSSFEDLVRISYSLIVGIVLVMILRFYFHTDLFVIPFRFRDLVLQTLLAIVLMCGLRITAKIFYDIYLRRSNRNGVYGLSGNALLDREMKYLLPREPIKVDMEAISKELQGKCVLVTGAASLILTVVVLLNLDAVARFLGATPDTLTYVKEYVGTIALFAVFFTVSYNLEVQVKANGAPHISTVGVISCALMNVVLDALFVLVFHWGVWGAAFATGLAGAGVLRFLASLIPLPVENPNALIRDVALDVGFKSQHHFSRTFKSYFGQNPSSIPKAHTIHVTADRA